MSNWIKAGQVIGIVGSGVETYYLTQTALRMGYQVFVYNHDEFNMAGSIADEHWIGPLDNRDELCRFAEACDVLLYASKDIDSDLVQALMTKTEVPQGYQLLALTQDKSLQKAQLDALQINVAPHTVVFNNNDLQASMSSIGYPALVSNNISTDHPDPAFRLDNPSDLSNLPDHLSVGTNILESYSPDARHFSIVVAVDENGQVSPITLSEVAYEGSRLKWAFNPPQIDNEIAVEMFRIALVLAEAYPMRGILTIHFDLTPQFSIYVTDILPFSSQVGVYTLASQNLSQYEMFIRAVTRTPIPLVNHYAPAIAFPFYEGQAQQVNQIIMNDAQAQVYYYNETHPASAKGHISFVLEELEDIYAKQSEINVFQ